MQDVKEIIKNHPAIQHNSNTVNSNKETSLTVNSNTVKSQFDVALEKLDASPEVTAQEIAKCLGDERSIDYYTILVKNSSVSRLLEALSFTKDADHRGKIKTKKPIYFLGILKRWGIKTKFKE